MNKFKEIENYLVDISVGETIVDYYDLFIDRFYDGRPVNIDSYCDALERELTESNKFDEDLICDYVEIVRGLYCRAEDDYNNLLERWKEERKQQYRDFVRDCR